MATDDTTLKATCLCGAVKPTFTLPSSSLPLPASLCHCNSCRHMTGTLALTTATLPSSYTPEKEILDKLTPFPFSDSLTQYFCQTCGTLMLAYTFFDVNDRSKGGDWDICTGCLEKTDGVVNFRHHIYIGDTLDGGFADFLPSIGGKALPRYSQHSGHESKTTTTAPSQLPLDWKEPRTSPPPPSPSDKLHCHCKCNGVQFWISRPSARSKEVSGAWPDFLPPPNSPQPHTDKSAWWLRANGTKFIGDVCACDSCRLDTGQEFHEWTFVPTVDISLDEEGKVPWNLGFGDERGWGTLKGYRSTNKPEEDVWRYHCERCGATVFYTTSERKDLVDVAVGVLDAPEGARAEEWVEFELSRLSFREDAVGRADTTLVAVEEGMKKFAAR